MREKHRQICNTMNLFETSDRIYGNSTQTEFDHRNSTPALTLNCYIWTIVNKMTLCVNALSWFCDWKHLLFQSAQSIYTTFHDERVNEMGWNSFGFFSGHQTGVYFFVISYFFLVRTWTYEYLHQNIDKDECLHGVQNVNYHNENNSYT